MSKSFFVRVGYTILTYPLCFFRIVSRQQVKSLIFCCILINHSLATTLVLPMDGNVVGSIKYTHPFPGDTLADMGVRYDIGLNQMINANPNIDPRQPLPSSIRVLIPSQFILPKGPRQGIVINLSEYRLYFFPVNDNVVITHPIGIGRKGWSTPVGATKIVQKETNPVWRPTANLIAASENKGVMIPNEFPGGSGNPLGKYAFRLGWPTYLIHGTSRIDGVGERVSAGCIRMLAQDIEYLFKEVSTGTLVRVVNMPVKLGHLGGDLYIEIHPVLAEQQEKNVQTDMNNALAKWNLTKIRNKPMLIQEIRHPSGVPKKIA